MVPMIFTGLIMKVYGKIEPKKILKFQSVWLYKYSPICILGYKIPSKTMIVEKNPFAQ